MKQTHIYRSSSFQLSRIHQKSFPPHLSIPIPLIHSITMAIRNPFKRSDRLPSEGAIMGMSDSVRNHAVAALAELAGTFLFLFFALSVVQVANTGPAAPPGSLPDVSKVLFIAIGFGTSVAVNVWIFYRVSGGMFNPAV
jgi:hypothetical protein